MNRYNIKYYFFLMLLPAMLLISCEDFFNVKKINIIDKDDLWNNPTKIEHLLSDIYAKIQYEDFSYFEGFWVFTQMSLSCASDEAFPSWQNGDFGSIERIQSQYGDEWFYLWPYDNIRNCNLFIEHLAMANIDEKLKAELQGEIRFIRAFEYFNLVKRFGGVPLVTCSMVYDPEDVQSLQKPRNTEQEIWNFIYSELSDIDLLLPKTRAARYKNRINKYIALSLKSRAMLYAASISEYGKVSLEGCVGVSAPANTYWERSYDASKEIIESEVYSLYNRYSDRAENYRQLFLDKNNGEYIWAKEYSLPYVAHDFDKYATPYSFVGGYGCGMNPTLEFVESYEYVDGTQKELEVNDKNCDPIIFDNPLDLFANKDPRLFATVYLPNSPCRGSVIEVRRGLYKLSDQTFTEASDIHTTTTLANGDGIKLMGKDGMIDYDDVTKSGFYQRKFLNEELTNIDFGRSDQPWPLFRLGEIYLNLAEAAFMLGKRDESLSAINKIRSRAGIRELRDEELTIERIRHERRIELAFENHRFWDLRRWRIAASNGIDKGILTEWQPTALYPWIIYENGKYLFTKADKEVPKPRKMFYERNYYIKFRSEEMTSNKLLVQNPGY